MSYLFTSERLGFRTWTKNDQEALYGINSNTKVMRFFPGLLTPEESDAFLTRMQRLYDSHGYCYFATELRSSACFIGFIGLSLQDFDAPFTPFTDIGWRLAPEYWGQGLATEGAKRCLQHGFENHHLNKIHATAPVVNQPSIRVMEKIGMRKDLEFRHPKLTGYPLLETCALYSISKDDLKH